MTNSIEQWTEAVIANCDWTAEIPATVTQVRVLAREVDQLPEGSPERAELRQVLEDIIDVRLREGDANPLVNTDRGLWDRKWFTMSEREQMIESWYTLKREAPDCVTVTNYPTAELYWEAIEMEDQVHVCEGPESRTARMLLALHSRDDDALQLVRNEVDGCARCWQSIAGWLANLLAGVREMDAGSPAAAADSVAAELARLLHG